MKIKFRNLAPVLASSVLLAAATASYGMDYSVSGQVWEGGTTSSVPAAGSSVYSTPATAVFTVTNTSPTSLFSFNSNGSADYTLSSFLTSGGDSLSFLSGSGAAGDSINNDLFQFTGTTTLGDNTKYTFEHDDGLLLYLDNTLVVNESGPTSAVSTTLCVGTGLTGCDYSIANPTGPLSFTLDYAEVSGAPAVLETSLPLTGPAPTPEPSSLILLGSGVLGMAGLVRRRLMA